MTTITRQNYLKLASTHPHLFPWEKAALLGKTEVEIRQLCEGHEAQRLNISPIKLLIELKKVGKVLAITDNGYAFNEIKGQYDNARIGTRTGLFLTPRGLDLRLFPTHWQSAFAVTEPFGNIPELHSFQFFDSQGHAVHRVYAIDETDMTQWQHLIETYADAKMPPIFPEKKQYNTHSHTAIDPSLAMKVEKSWREMLDVHQFYDLLQQYHLTRQDAFRHVSDELAYQVSVDAMQNLMAKVYQDENEVMIFTGNDACVQIYTGVIIESYSNKGWLNLSGYQFSYHLREDQVHECWVVKKPVTDGHVTSLEIFDKKGRQLSQVYGARQENEPEQAHWRAQITSLTRF